MSYPTWRIDSWYEDNRWIGFKVVKGTYPFLTVADNGFFRSEQPNDPICKQEAREAAMRMREALTLHEADPRVLAKECRSILREILSLAVSDNSYPTAIVVPAIQTNNWLRDRLDRLCAVLQVKDDT